MVEALGLLNEGIKSSSNVQFVGKGFNFKDYGHGYRGSLQVLTTLLNSEYLHDRVRAKGGAYGCRASFDYSGLFTIVSYRDPNLKDTYGVYEEASAFIESLDAKDGAIEKFIIGAMRSVDSAKTPQQLGQAAYTHYIIGKTFEDAQRLREEILDTSAKDLLALSGFLKDFNDCNALCTLGNSDIVETNSNMFKQIITLE